MSLPENQDPKPQLEDDEFIEVFTTPLKDLWAECKLLEAEGYAIDARVGTLADGIEIAKQFKLTKGKEKEDNGCGDSALTWCLPLGPDGTVADVILADRGYYIKWLFECLGRVHGCNLEVAIVHVFDNEVTRTFKAVMG
ncbi:hypothetical protein PG996_005652 [Apiospora saccharicola]|uniref:Uncharacterized protein n=1 Tax=Apiospora saccharicola TaxID=335842 RepID=A0ABR1VQW9_9PEZI